MVRQGRGAIVNVGSVAGKVGVPYSVYAASKHAVEAITEAMHFELAQLGIRVAVVEPGQFATGFSGNSVIAAGMPRTHPSTCAGRRSAAGCDSSSAASPPTPSSWPT